MNQPTRYQNQRPQQQSRARMKEQREEDYAGDDQEAPSLDQLAGTAARRIIRSTGIEDTTQNWRALKAAFITGYDSAR